VLGGEHVVAEIRLKRAPPACPDPRLPRKVVDDIAISQKLDDIALDEIHRDEFEAVVLSSTTEVHELVGPGVVRVEAVDAQDLRAVGEKRFGEL
jgi:hypothetical protein